ncbi:MAG: hypothetical protein KGL45_10775 [Gammaproteobacteria bacterium]|nr:hypothetical protein [Gammaproteobacteria bacterium]
MSATRQLQARAARTPVADTTHPQAASATPARLLPERSSGWDPFEVWRTRVKPPRDPAAWEPRT